MHAFLRLHLIPRDATSSPACTATVNILFSLWGIKMFIYLFIYCQYTQCSGDNTSHTGVCKWMCHSLWAVDKQWGDFFNPPHPSAYLPLCLLFWSSSSPGPIMGYTLVWFHTWNHSKSQHFFFFFPVRRNVKISKSFFLPSFSITQLEYKSKHSL